MISNNTIYDFNALPKDKVWVTSDLHFFHENVIRYCKRPFDSSEEMNEILIDRWNMVIGDDDLIICCGDFSLGSPKKTKEVLKRLNGNKVLIKGNHEKSVLGNKENRDLFNGGIYDLLNITVIDDEVEYGFQDIVLCHYPMISWNKSHRGSWQLFGHVHGVLDCDDKLSPNQIDVGVDSNDYRPISYQEIKEKITIKNLNRLNKC